MAQQSTTAGVTQQDQMARDLKKLEDVLLKLHRAKITIENFQEGSQQVLNDYL